MEGLTSKDQEKTGQAYQQLLATASTKPFSFFWVSVELMQSNLLPDDFRAQQERDLVEAYQPLTPKNPNRLFWRNFIALAAKDEVLLALKNLDKLTKGLEIGNLAAVGQLYAINKKPAKVQVIIDALQVHTTCDYIGQVSTSCAAAYYYIGQLQAQIGETEAAINNLQKAKDLGLGNELHRFHFSRYLTVLYDLPAFQQIIQPIWPDAATQKEKYLDKLTAFMENEKAYQSPELTLTQLSEQVKIPAHYLSQVINEKLDCNFLDFVNGYRVEDAKEKLIDPKFDHYTIVSVAYEAGFNSKSTFLYCF